MTAPTRTHRKYRPFICSLALGVFILGSGMEAQAQDAGTHDLECMASVPVLAASPDEKIRGAAPVVFAYYLGRLDQLGRSAEQIQAGMEKIALSSDARKRTGRKEFAESCGAAVNERIKALNAIGARDWSRMQQNEHH